MRKTKLYNNYSGKYFDVLELDLRSIRNSDISDLSFIEVDEDALIDGDSYILENGSTIKFNENGAYEVINRTPLGSEFDIYSLMNNYNQLRLFWTLVVNCKNGTHFGI